jgi:hypothetical protein
MTLPSRDARERRDPNFFDVRCVIPGTANQSRTDGLLEGAPIARKESGTLDFV